MQRCGQKIIYKKKSPVMTVLPNYEEQQEEKLDDPKQKLNQFISTKIRKEALRKKSTEWNKEIEHTLLDKLIPEIKKEFPLLRPSTSLIKRSFKKALSYLKQLKPYPEAFSKSGELNLGFIIKENLRTLAPHSTKESYSLALTAAKNIADYVQQVEGVRPKFDLLAKTIYSLDQHLLTKNGEIPPSKCPFEVLEPMDHLILQLQLDALSIEVPLSKEGLVEKIHEGFETLKTIHQVENLPLLLSFIHARKLYPSLSILKRFSKQKIGQIERFIQLQIRLDPTIEPIRLVRKILFLYHIASHPSKRRMQIDAAINYIRSLSNDRYIPCFQQLGHEIYSFINQEILRLKSERRFTSVDELLTLIVDSFESVPQLPTLNEKQIQELETLIFKILSDLRPLKELNNRPLCQELELGLLKVYLETSRAPIEKVVFLTYERYHRLKSIQIPEAETESFFGKESVVDRIINISAEGELVFGKVKVSLDNIVIRTLLKKWNLLKETKELSSHKRFIDLLVEKLIKDDPSLSLYETSLRSRALFYYKIFWYQLTKGPSESTYDRFLKWYLVYLSNKEPEASNRDLLESVIKISDQSLPLVPQHLSSDDIL